MISTLDDDGDSQIVIDSYYKKGIVHIRAVRRRKVSSKSSDNLQRIAFAAFSRVRLAETIVTEKTWFQNLAKRFERERESKEYVTLYKELEDHIIRVTEELLFSGKEDEMKKCHCCGGVKRFLRKKGLFVYCSRACYSLLADCRNSSSTLIHGGEHWETIQPLMWDGEEYTMIIKKEGEIKRVTANEMSR